MSTTIKVQFANFAAKDPDHCYRIHVASRPKRVDELKATLRERFDFLENFVLAFVDEDGDESVIHDDAGLAAFLDGPTTEADKTPKLRVVAAETIIKKLGGEVTDLKLRELCILVRQLLNRMKMMPRRRTRNRSPPWRRSSSSSAPTEPTTLGKESILLQTLLFH